MATNKTTARYAVAFYCAQMLDWVRCTGVIGQANKICGLENLISKSNLGMTAVAPPIKPHFTVLPDGTVNYSWIRDEATTTTTMAKNVSCKSSDAGTSFAYKILWHLFCSSFFILFSTFASIMFVVIVIFMVCVCLSTAFRYVSLFGGEWVLRYRCLSACSIHTAIGESVLGRWCIHWDGCRWLFFICNSFTCFQFDCVGSLAPTVSNSMSQCVRVDFIRTLVLVVCFSSSFMAYSSSSLSSSSSWMSLWVRCKQRQGWRLCSVFIVSQH